MIIGITGAFGCGKSTCLKMFKNFNFETISADEICHQIYETHEQSFVDTLNSRWQINVCDDNGKINRKKIAEIVFENQKELDFLTSVLSPMIQKQLVKKISYAKDNKQNLAVEIPLLFEADYQKYFDKTIVIYASKANRVKNLQKRNFDVSDMIVRDKIQLPLNTKLELADYALINSGSLGLLEQQLEKLISKLNIEM